MTETRKTVTVVFADVSGSTELGERLDPEAFRRVMESYFSEARAALERHGGTVEKFIGDAVVGVFGIPTTHEDDALRAVKAAAEMRERLDLLNQTLESERSVTLAIRTAVNTGEVVTGDATEGQFFATGDAVNVAARLEQAAEAGEILLGERTYRLVQNAAQVEKRLQPLHVKGKADALTAFRLLEIDAGASPVTRRFDTPFVGRVEEVHRLTECFERSASELTPVLVTVLGAAGIGKTRLAAEFVGAVERRGRVLQGRCLSYGEGITFWPLQEILRGLEQRPLKVPDPGEATSTEETFWAYRKLFEALARERPLLVVLEDIHWAEPPLLDLVEHIVEWTKDVPMIFLCLARPELIDARPGWPGDRIELEPLGETDAQTLVHELGEGLDIESQERAITVAEGNPLFLEQILALAAEEESGEIDVPQTIQALLTTRLDQLDPDERGVVEAAAVVGKEFWRSALLHLSPDDTEISPVLQRLIRRRLIQPATSSLPGEDAFRFGHILIREAAYSGISKQRRANLHERFSDWLEKLGTPYDEIVGYHLEQAYVCRFEIGPLDQSLPVLRDRASGVLERVARQAIERGDYGAATNLLERARTLSAPDDSRGLFLSVLLGEAYEALGRIKEADALYQETISAGKRLGDRRAQNLALVNHVWLTCQMNPESWVPDEIRQTANHAVEVFRELDDDFGLARAWRLDGQVDWSLCLYDAARQADERVLLHAQRAGDQHAVRYGVIAVTGELLRGTTPVAEATSHVESLLEEVVDNASLRALTLCVLGALASMSGDFARGRSLYVEAVALLEELGLDYQKAAHSMYMEEIALLAGDPDFAERELRAAYKMLEAQGERGWRSTIAALLAEALLMLGRAAEAEQYADIALSITSADDITSQARGRSAKAKALAARGQYEDAERLAREAVTLASTTDDLFMQSRLLIGLGEVLRRGGHDEAAIPVLQEAIEISERKQSLVTAARARTELSQAIGVPMIR